MRFQIVANRVKTLREAAELSVHELADKAGIAVGYLSEIENMKANPTVGELEQIAHALGKSLFDLLRRHEHQPSFKHHYHEKHDKD